MENQEVEYRINEQGMVLEYLERKDSYPKKTRALSSAKKGFLTRICGFILAWGVSPSHDKELV